MTPPEEINNIAPRGNNIKEDKKMINYIEIIESNQPKIMKELRRAYRLAAGKNYGYIARICLYPDGSVSIFECSNANECPIDIWNGNCYCMWNVQGWNPDDYNRRSVDSTLKNEIYPYIEGIYTEALKEAMQDQKHKEVCCY